MEKKTFRLFLLNPHNQEIVKKFIFFSDLPVKLIDQFKKGNFSGASSFFGDDWQDKLCLSTPITGGDVDEFDDWIATTSKIETTDLVKSNVGPFIYDVSIFPDDSIFEIKEKIFISLGIPVYRQHLFRKKIPQSTVHETEYEIIFGEVKHIIDSARDTTDVGGVMTDYEFYKLRKDVTIKTYETIYTVGDKLGEIHYMYDVKDYVDKIGAEVLINQEYQRNLFYYGVIMKYFPIMDIVMFNKYLRSDTDAFNSYPVMNRSKGELQAKYVYQQRLELEYYRNIDVYDTFDKSLECFFKRVGCSSSPKYNQENSVYTKNILDSFGCSEKYVYIYNVVHHEDKIYKISKYYDQIDTKLKLSIEREAATKLDVSKEYTTLIFLHQCSDDEDDLDYSSITFYSNGSYVVDMTGGAKSTNIEALVTSYYKDIGVILGQIKDDEDKIFKFENKYRKYPDFKLNTISIGNIALDIVWVHKMSPHKFMLVKHLIDQYCANDIFYERENNYAKTINNYLLKINKGTFRRVDRFLLKKNAEVRDYYTILRDDDRKKTWDHRYRGAMLDITKGVTNVTFSINDVEYTPFLYCKKYILTFMKAIEAIPEPQSTGKVFSGDMKKKCLELDEDLYNFVTADGVKCARICQKKFRPIAVYTDEEYISLADKANTFLFKSYTTGDDLWYKCPPHLPLFGFITEKHPKGYCIPKCKEVDTKGDKNKKITAMCMGSRVINKGDMGVIGTAYNIIKFGKAVDFGRREYLHEHIYTIMKASQDKLYMKCLTLEDTSYEYQVLTNYAAFKNIDVTELIADIHLLFTEKVYTNLSLESSIDYSVLREAILAIDGSPSSITWRSIIGSIIFNIYGDVIIMFETEIIQANEILTKDNSIMSVIVDKNIDTSSLYSERTVLMIELNSNIYQIVYDDILQIPQENLNTLRAYITKADKKQVTNFCSYESIERYHPAKIIIKERYVHGNRILFVLAEYGGAMIAIGIHNSYLRGNQVKVMNNEKAFDSKKYDLPPAAVIKFCKERSFKFNPVFQCIGSAVTKEAVRTCNLIGFRLNDEYFWFNSTSYSDIEALCGKQPILVEFVNTNLAKINDAIIKNLPPNKEVFTGAHLLYYKMNVYKLFKKEFYKIMSLYKARSLRKLLRKYLADYERDYIVGNVEADFPYSHELIEAVIMHKGTFKDFGSYQEDMTALAKELSILTKEQAFSLIICIARQICNFITKIPNHPIENITVSEMKYETAFICNGDTPTEVKIKHITSKYTTTSGLFYTGGRLNVTKELIKPMVRTLQKEFASELYFLSQITDFGIYLVNDYFRFKQYNDERISIECL